MPELSMLAAPAVLALIGFLAFSSQILFYYLEPGPLSKNEFIYFNALAACMLITYAFSCIVDPGTIPKNWSDSVDDQKRGRLRWCRKCEAHKPPRAHHCRKCKRYDPHAILDMSISRGEERGEGIGMLGDLLLICGCRCIPRMDHHCPWT